MTTHKRNRALRVEIEQHRARRHSAPTLPAANNGSTNEMKREEAAEQCLHDKHMALEKKEEVSQPVYDMLPHDFSVFEMTEQGSGRNGESVGSTTTALSHNSSNSTRSKRQGFRLSSGSSNGSSSSTSTSPRPSSPLVGHHQNQPSVTATSTAAPGGNMVKNVINFNAVTSNAENSHERPSSSLLGSSGSSSSSSSSKANGPNTSSTNDRSRRKSLQHKVIQKQMRTGSGEGRRRNSLVLSQLHMSFERQHNGSLSATSSPIASPRECHWCQQKDKLIEQQRREIEQLRREKAQLESQLRETRAQLGQVYSNPLEGDGDGDMDIVMNKDSIMSSGSKGARHSDPFTSIFNTSDFNSMTMDPLFSQISTNADYNDSNGYPIDGTIVPSPPFADLY